MAARLRSIRDDLVTPSAGGHALQHRCQDRGRVARFSLREGREVIAVLEDRTNPKPSYIEWLEWRDGSLAMPLPTQS
jgi:hypothetical protein